MHAFNPRSLVSRHGFSRAEKADKKTWALAPAGWPFPCQKTLMRRKRTHAPQLAFALYQGMASAVPKTSINKRGL
jgi:hypothetical protein